MTGWVGIERPGGPAPERPRSRFVRGFDPDSLTTREELLRAATELTDEIDQITAQIEAAKLSPAVVEEKGTGWLLAANVALGRRIRLIRRVTGRLQAMHKAERRAKQEAARAAREQATQADEAVRRQAERQNRQEALRRASADRERERLDLVARLLWQRHPEIADALWAEVQAELPIGQEGREAAA